MIAIVTDSTCDLSPEILEKYKIKVIPLHIHFGDEDYLDGVTITQKDFYAKLVNKNTPHPSTSPPDVKQFHEFYKRLAVEYDDIISIHIGSYLSHTFKHANQAVHAGRMQFFTERLKSGRFDKFKIRVIESNNVSMATGMLVLQAAIWANEGMSAEQIERQLLAIRERLRIVFTVNELTYMRRSEKVSALKNFLGSLLGINPVIEGSGNQLAPIKSVKGIQGAMKFIASHTLKNRDVSQSNIVLISEIAGNTQSNFRILKQLLSGTDQSNEIVCLACDIGPSVGTHVGPGGIAVAYIAKAL